MTRGPALSVDRLRELLQYDPTTGALRWLATRGKAKAGDVAGCTDDRGYLVLGIDGKRHYAHRIAWALYTGAFPREVVDHVNGDKADNRWTNLRDVTVKVNTQNRRAVSRRSKTQVLGVRRYGKRFRAQLSVNGTPQYLGTFDTAEEAQEVYLAAKRRMHEGCTL